MKNHFAANMQAMRKHSGMTQEQAAEKLGFSRSVLASYEEGRGQPDLERFAEICEAYSITYPLAFIQQTLTEDEIAIASTVMQFKNILALLEDPEYKSAVRRFMEAK